MNMEMSYDELCTYVIKQIDNLFGLRDDTEKDLLIQTVDVAIERTEYCFSYTENKYYNINGKTYFNPFHSGQYAIFLYFLANSIFKIGPYTRTLADRLYYLNKTLNSLDLFYEVNMPKVFFLDHPVGSVMGRAVYGEYFSFSQNCTVGNNKGLYPIIGQNVRMMSGSKILGNCKIGDNVILAANACVKDSDVPPCSIVFGSTPHCVVKKKEETYFK